jgi:outer membrane protein with beta-barrel domain
MKRVITIGLMMIIFIFTLSGTTLAEDKKKSNWYIGFGLGTGTLQIEGETADDAYEDNPNIDVDPELTLHFGVGAIINPKLHLGFDLSVIRQAVDSGIGNDYESFQINNYFVALSYYPWTKGLFLKVGGGLSNFVYEYDGEYNVDSETYSGTGYLVGLGYDFWLGKSFNLGIHAEYSRQSYSDSYAPDDTEFTSIYLSFYWF